MTANERRSPEGAASSRATATVLTLGALGSAACLVMALVLEMAGRSLATGDALDWRAVLDALVELRPWGWATVGVLAVIATPAAGLITTAFEYRGRRESLLAIGVLLILVLSLAIALVR